MSHTALLYAVAGSSPSGGGFTPGPYMFFEIIVDNLTYSKEVGLWGHRRWGGWAFFPGEFIRTVSDNKEIWGAKIGGDIDQFAVKYSVAGNIYWDNNSGHDYRLMVEAAEGTGGIGTVALNPNVIGWGHEIDSSGTLNVSILVKNIAFAKVIGIVYTKDNWNTFNYEFGSYKIGYAPPKTPYQPDAELWEVNIYVGKGTKGSFAIFYDVDSNTYWDNNFGSNYSF